MMNSKQNKYDINDKNIRRYLPAFVGAIKDENIKVDEFFKALKKTDLKKWKNVVKKFYLNFDFDINNLIK